MTIWLIFAIYVAMSASGLLLIKLGTETSNLALENGIFNIQLAPKLIIGFIVYVCSFLLSVYLIERMKITVFYPTAIGIMLVLTSVLGYFVLKEHIGVAQIVGMVLILAGIIVINVN